MVKKTMKMCVFAVLWLILAVLTAGAQEETTKSPEEQLKAVLAGLGITVSGAVEVESAYEKTDFDDPAADDESESDFSLSTVELGIDVRVNPYVLGHVLFLYEEEPDADIEVDEGYIRLENPEGIPLYVLAGRQYLPFGRFESHFISDPLTLELGEIQETSVVGGYANDVIGVFVGVFNGDIDKIDNDNDHIRDGVVGFAVTLADLSDVQIIFGGSWINHIADSDALSETIEETTGGDGIADKIAGYNAFASISVMEKVALELEFLGAADEFEAGELDASATAYQPHTFNVELALRVTGEMEIAARYGGSNDCGDFLPEKLIGFDVSYDIFDNTALSAEIQYGEFENEDTITTVTGQLAIWF